MARAILFGTPVSSGIALGKVRIVHRAGSVDERHILPADCDSEIARLNNAVAQVTADLQAACEQVPAELSEQCDIIHAHIQLCQDPKLLGAAKKRILDQHICASWALGQTVEELCALFQSMNDAYLRERAQDIKAVSLRLQQHIAGTSLHTHDTCAPHILLAEDISPSDVLSLNPRVMQGLVTMEGGPTSHTAIVARSLHLPAVVGVTGLLDAIVDGDFIIIDAISGSIYIAPDNDELVDFTTRQEEFSAWEHKIHANAALPAETLDGVRVTVQANMENTEESTAVLASGAEGVGLYRTEFAYLRSRSLPKEAQLYEEYAAIVRRVAPQRVVFRTLDAGADKMLTSQMALKEPNPNLGLRGIRFCLRHREVFYPQLRALLRVAALGSVALMIPMVTGLQEVQEVRRMIVEVSQSLSAAGIEHDASVPLGVMIETPSAVLVADSLARECDFFSIGTNDLLCYTMAIDRSNKHVAYLHDPLHPAMVLSLKRVIDCAHREGIGVSVCGELSTDPYGLALLIGMGVDSVSASSSAVPAMKHMIRQLHAETCTNMAHSVLMSTDSAASGRMLRETLAQSLGEELTFHHTMLQTNG